MTTAYATKTKWPVIDEGLDTKSSFKFENYIAEYDKIYKFFVETIVPKYDLKDCFMEDCSEEFGIDVEYIFKINDKLSSKELSDLSLKINMDLYFFCIENKIKSFSKTLVLVSR
ncbi:hypothetical protein [Methanobrevibacter ruminantium]|uniref:hypothetical protein n=1 Tax=Methanobrevibacter ruminantium TaxID=83816 RepID=UPI0026EBACDC|nr:hypothetical protein [Methanobrevibacter ruminantium]